MTFDHQKPTVQPKYRYIFEKEKKERKIDPQHSSTQDALDTKAEGKGKTIM